MAEKESRIVYNTSKVMSWKIPEVSPKGETGTYEIIGEMTSPRTQDVLTEEYGIEIPSMPLLWAICTRAHELRNENLQESESLKQFIRQGFKRLPNTSTRLRYNPIEKDEIIHNYKTPNQYSIDEGLVGPDGFIYEIPDANVLEHLLGTSDIEKINNVSQWINETDVYLWRFNSRPNKRVERVARFYVDVDGLSLVCDRDLLFEYPAFRVLKVD